LFNEKIAVSLQHLGNFKAAGDTAIIMRRSNLKDVHSECLWLSLRRPSKLWL